MSTVRPFIPKLPLPLDAYYYQCKEYEVKIMDGCDLNLNIIEDYISSSSDRNPAEEKFYTARGFFTARFEKVV